MITKSKYVDCTGYVMQAMLHVHWHIYVDTSKSIFTVD